jgi:hypothetical protein
MAEAATVLACLAVFLGIYALLQRRSESASVRWGWLAAIVGCAAVAVLLGAVVR